MADHHAPVYATGIMSQGWGQYPPPPSSHGHAIVHAHHKPIGVPTCRSCGYTGQMRYSQKVSTGGWILFAICLVFVVCIPFCWVPLVAMKDTAYVCPCCHQLQGAGYV